MKTILFPTDFSKAAEHAFIYALHVAEKLDATITTLHVYQLPDIKAINLPQTLQEAYTSIDLEAFENYRDTIPSLRQIAEANNLEHVSVKHSLETGEVIPTIIRTAKRLEADLIILGTRGASGLKEVFLGSVAGEVLENAPCPVIAVPDEADFDGVINRIAVTTNYQEEEEKALNKLIEFLEPFQATIYCVNVDITHTSAYVNRMGAWSQKFAGTPNVHFEVIKGDFIEQTLIDYLDTKAIDILVMFTQKRGFFQELFHYSRTKTMAYHAKTPIMSIPEGILA